MSALQSDRTSFEEECELEARRCGHTCDQMLSGSGACSTLLENIWELRALYDQKRLTFIMNTTVYRPGRPIMMVAVSRPARFYVMPMSAWRCIEVLLYRHLRLRSNWSPRHLRVSNGVTQFIMKLLGYNVPELSRRIRQGRILWMYSLVSLSRCFATLKVVLLDLTPI